MPRPPCRVSPQACKPCGSWSRCVSRLFNDSRLPRSITFEISTGCPQRSTFPTVTMRGALLRHSYHGPFQKFETTGPPFAANWQLVMSIEEPIYIKLQDTLLTVRIRVHGRRRSFSSHQFDKLRIHECKNLCLDSIGKLHATTEDAENPM